MASHFENDACLEYLLKNSSLGQFLFTQDSVWHPQMHSSPKLVFERMIQATNRHDLDAMVECFAEDFRSEQPFHPERNFVGQAGVRKNWTFFFSTIPDMQVGVKVANVL